MDVARALGKLPHELGRGFAITYFQTLLESLSAPDPTTRNDSEEDGLQLVDVDALVRKGKSAGFGDEL